VIKPKPGRPKAVLNHKHTRERIIAAALEVLSEEGIVGISTRRIATRAKANQALIYYYFGTLQKLMLEVIGRIAEQTAAQYAVRYTDNAPFLDTWRADVDALRTAERDKAVTKVWFEAIAAVVNEPGHTESTARNRYRLRTILRRAVADDLRRRYKGADVSADADAISALLSLVRTGIAIDVLLGAVEGHDGALALLERLLAERFR